MQKFVNLVRSRQEPSNEYTIYCYLQNSVSIQPRMSLSEFGDASIQFFSSLLNHAPGSRRGRGSAASVPSRRSRCSPGRSTTSRLLTTAPSFLCFRTPSLLFFPCAMLFENDFRCEEACSQQQQFEIVIIRFSGVRMCKNTMSVVRTCLCRSEVYTTARKLQVFIFSAANTIKVLFGSRILPGPLGRKSKKIL